jgi:hypothetical protein
MITPSQQPERPTRQNAVTAPLSPSQKAAREFWRQAGADGMPPFYVMSQYYAQLTANSDNLPVVTAALEQLLTGLGYATDVDTVFSELTAGQGEELGYWAGRYCLFDGGGNRFDLVVGRNGATLTVPPAVVDMTSLPAGTDMAGVTVLSSVGFSDGVLQLANANALISREISLVRLQASLRFTLPVSDASFDSADPVAAMFQSTAPLCKGTFVVVGGDSAGLRPVNGKRGAWTQAGVDQAADGDPAAAWYGQYVLLDVTDVTAVKQVPDPICIYNDPQYGLTFQWGNGEAAVYGSNVTYNNNVLRCANQNDDRTQYAMQFVAPQAGAAEINLAVNTTGVVRSYKGYWVGRYPPSSLPTSQARLAKRPMTAVYSAASDASAGGYSKAIDVSTLTPGVTDQIGLPDGAVGNSYALTLDLRGCAATDKFAWTVSNDADGRVAIAPSGGTTVQFSLANLSAPTDDGQPLQVTVQLTKTSATPPVTYTMLFEIAVIQCDAISLTPTVLPPVVVGTAYTQKLAAQGARGSFTWSDPINDPNTSLPAGLTWDPSSQQLSGTVTDATQADKAFSLALGLAASDVIMDRLTASRVITVQSASAVASDMPPWERYLIIVGSGMGIMVLATCALNRLLAARANAETNAVIQAGYTNVEKATNGNPRSASKSIIESEGAMFPTVEEKIVYCMQQLEFCNEAIKELNTTINANEDMLSKLERYYREYRDDPQHNRDDDEVLDTYLSSEKFRTFGDVSRGIVFIIGANEKAQFHLSSFSSLSNRLQTEIASDRIKIDEHDSSEPNNKSLLSDR